jgi:general secretion pathway protein K
MDMSRIANFSSSHRGLALVVVLWVLVLLSLIAASFTRTTRTEVNLTRNLIDNAEAEALAEAGVYRAVLGLLAGQRAIDFGGDLEQVLQGRPASREALARRPEVEMARANTLDPREGWRVDGTVYAWAFAGGEVRVSIQDEAGKIDLNAASDELLRGLFLTAAWTGPDGGAVGLDEAEAGALVDAVRDFADDDDLTRLNGAEDRDYAEAGLPWGAKDAAFAAVEELQQVLGVNAPIYQAVAPALTVHSGSEGIDPDVAPRAVLLALPAGGETQVEDFLAARAGAGRGAALEFPGAGGHAARSRAKAFTVTAQGRTAAGAVFIREAVVAITRNAARPFEFLSWRRAARPLETADPETDAGDAGG